MPDQLLLDLAVAVPRLPSSIRPMLPRPATEPFDSDEHLFEPAWGGLRALAFVEPDPATGALGVRFLRADGRDVTAAFPDLADLPDALASPFAILDGELVVPDGSGHADGKAMGARLSASAAGRASGGAAGGRVPGGAARGRVPGGAAGGQVPGSPTGRPLAVGGPASGPSTGRQSAAAVFLAFDLLYTEGRPLLGQPLARRRQLLRSLVTPAAAILVVPAVPADGCVLFEAAVAQRLPGILARHVRGPYLPGRRSSLWRSVATAGRTSSMEAAEGPAGDDVPSQVPVLALIRKLPLAFDGD